MDIKLIALDLDGTFLDDRKNIPPENLRALAYAAERGVLIVPATGRICAGIPDALRSLPFLRYYITVNGAYVYDAAEDKTLHRAEIPAETALRITDYADEQSVIYDCYKDNWGYMTRSMYDVAEEYVTNPGTLKMVKNLRTPVESLPELLRRTGEPVQKIQLYLKDPQRKAALMADLSRRFPETAVTSALPFSIEINTRSADKGQALTVLCDRLGLPMEEVMAFGDETNDITMLRAAGLGVAMANAPEEVRRLADHVTGSNNDAGVARAIRSFIV